LTLRCVIREKSPIGTRTLITTGCPFNVMLWP
jgi:hypothetical protein